MKLSGLGQSVLATFVAVVLTATAVGAAVEPARAVESNPASLVAANISVQAHA